MSDLKISITTSMSRLPRDLVTLLSSAQQDVEKTQKEISTLMDHIALFGGMPNPNESKRGIITKRLISTMKELEAALVRLNDITILFNQYSDFKLNPQSLEEASRSAAPELETAPSKEEEAPPPSPEEEE